uniref:Poly(ADP-ribose) glycohydrolase n=1 Tax=Caenorhabditis japonica TaxID=281687 RepID=A0A8R1E7J0_CAEJA
MGAPKRCDERQNTPEWRDKFQRLRIECLAIDALHFKGTPQTTLRQQLKREMIFRELHKAYVGFSAQPGFTEIPIVSGWWGCGAFNGNKPLKYPDLNHVENDWLFITMVNSFEKLQR